MPPSSRVVVTAGWRLRAVSVLTAAMAVGLWPNAVAALGGGLDPQDQVPAVVEVVVALLVWFLALACTATTWVVWWFRQTFGPDEATVRVLGPTGRVRIETATRLRLVRTVARTSRRGELRPVQRLQVTGPGRRRLPTTAGADTRTRRGREAQVVLLGWAQRRPELVVDDQTRAYLDELARGVRDGAVRRT